MIFIGIAIFIGIMAAAYDEWFRRPKELKKLLKRVKATADLELKGFKNDLHK